jgi:hypothetical protein
MHAPGVGQLEMGRNKEAPHGESSSDSDLSSVLRLLEMFSVSATPKLMRMKDMWLDIYSIFINAYMLYLPIKRYWFYLKS